MIKLNQSIWQIIDDMQSTSPFSLPGVEKILGQSLREEMQKSNEFFQFYSGRELALAGSTTIVNIDLRLPRPTTASAGMLVLHVASECISLAQVRQQHHRLEITGTPRGRSIDEATTYTLRTAWGEIDLGFQEKNADCLGYVGFKPNK